MPKIPLIITWILDEVRQCDQNGKKKENSGTQRRKKTIWTKTQGLKWQFTPYFYINLSYKHTITYLKGQQKTSYTRELPFHHKMCQVADVRV
ncbi:hypothetical protein Hanom_Chr13g01215791 [Helianthus anomalus]